MITGRVNTVKENRLPSSAEAAGAGCSRPQASNRSFPSCGDERGIRRAELAPEKPFADRGCDEQMAACRDVSMSAHFLRALSSQGRNTTRSVFVSTHRMPPSVNVSQPLPPCDPGSPARTVNVALSSSTPRRAQTSRLSVVGSRYGQILFCSCNSAERWRPRYAAGDGRWQGRAPGRRLDRVPAENHHLRSRRAASTRMP